MACKVFFASFVILLALALAAPVEKEINDLEGSEKGDLQTAASHWGGHWGGYGYGGLGYGGYYPYYGYGYGYGWGWPSYGWYGHGWPYYGHHGYWW